MKDILVIKLGGILLNNNIIIHRFFKILNQYYQSCNQDILIVHGGESWINHNYYNIYYMNSINDMYSNIHNDNNLDSSIKIGILSGTINKNIIQHARKNNFNVVGLSVTDGNNIILNKCNIKNYSSLCTDFSLKLIQYLFSQNIMPIISPIGITRDNELINIDSDIVAMLLAVSLKARLIILTDVNGILDGKGNEIEIMTEDISKKLILSGIITQGMITKINTALYVSKALSQPVNISSLINTQQLEKLFSGDIIGTSVHI